MERTKTTPKMNLPSVAPSLRSQQRLVVLVFCCQATRIQRGVFRVFPTAGADCLGPEVEAPLRPSRASALRISGEGAGQQARIRAHSKVPHSLILTSPVGVGFVGWSCVRAEFGKSLAVSWPKWEPLNGKFLHLRGGCTGFNNPLTGFWRRSITFGRHFYGPAGCYFLDLTCERRLKLLLCSYALHFLPCLPFFAGLNTAPRFGEHARG